MPALPAFVYWPLASEGRGQRKLKGKGVAEARRPWLWRASLLGALGIAFAPVGLTRGRKQLLRSPKGTALDSREQAGPPLGS